jgi:hypothetical protein
VLAEVALKAAIRIVRFAPTFSRSAGLHMAMNRKSMAHLLPILSSVSPRIALRFLFHRRNLHMIVYSKSLSISSIQYDDTFITLEPLRLTPYWCLILKSLKSDIGTPHYLAATFNSVGETN